MNLIISADDYGLSRTITDQILGCYDQGALSSVSVMANGEDFEYAMDEYRRRPGLRLGVHLNIFEGKALSGRDKTSLLVDKDGDFYHSYLSLWRLYWGASRLQKSLLKGQIKDEFAAQMSRVKPMLRAGEDLCVDGHQHVHLIPFVLEVLLELKDQFGFSYVRTLREPSGGFKYVMRSLIEDKGANFIKHLLLNNLSKRARPKLAACRIASCDYFVGVLYSGRMSLDFVQAGLVASAGKKASTVEILFHPFQAGSGDQKIWAKQQDLKTYYCSSRRLGEIEAVKSPMLKEMIKRYGK